MKLLAPIIILIPALVPTSAFALVDVRAHYGSLQSNPSAFNAQMDLFVKDGPKVKAPSGYGVDVLFDPPLVPIVAGLRHETFGGKESGAGSIGGTAVTTKAEFTGNRTSALLGFRPISLPVFYFGALLQYTLAQKLKYRMASTNAGGSTSVKSFDMKSQPGYGAGVEAGARLGKLQVGAEVGYVILKGKDPSDSIGIILDSKMNPIKMDMSGTYFKVVVGTGF